MVDSAPVSAYRATPWPLLTSGGVLHCRRLLRATQWRSTVSGWQTLVSLPAGGWHADPPYLPAQPAACSSLSGFYPCSIVALQVFHWSQRLLVSCAAPAAVSWPPCTYLDTTTQHLPSSDVDAESPCSCHHRRLMGEPLLSRN